MKDENKPVTVRGITVEVGPVRLLSKSHNISYKAYLDEKPIGRGMQAHWQRCIILEGEMNALTPQVLAQRIAKSLRRSAVVSPDASIVVTAQKGGVFSRTLPQVLQDRILREISKELRP